MIKNKQTFYIKFPVGSEVWLSQTQPDFKDDGTIETKHMVDGPYTVVAFDIKVNKKDFKVFYHIVPKNYLLIYSSCVPSDQVFVSKHEALERHYNQDI